MAHDVGRFDVDLRVGGSLQETGADGVEQLFGRPDLDGRLQLIDLCQANARGDVKAVISLVGVACAAVTRVQFAVLGRDLVFKRGDLRVGVA